MNDEQDALHATIPQPQTELLERLAAREHKAWSGWMQHLFSKCKPQSTNGKTTGFWMPREWSERWQRQMETPYGQLSEVEKESDRAEARDILAIVNAAALPSPSPEKYRDALQHIMQVLGPSVPETCENACEGCHYEISEALRTLREVGIEYIPRKSGVTPAAPPVPSPAVCLHVRKPVCPDCGVEVVTLQSSSRSVQLNPPALQALIDHHGEQVVAEVAANLSAELAVPSPAVDIEHENDITAAECLQLIGGPDGCGPASLREVVAAFHERGALLSRLQEDGACAGDSDGRLSRAPSQRDTGTLEDLSEWNAGPETGEGKKEVELVSRLRAAIPQPQTEETDTEDLTRVDSL